MVQLWEWQQPFKRLPRISKFLGFSENVRGEPLKPALPPEYFADMAINHRKQLLESMLPGAQRFLTELPAFDKSTFGQKLSCTVFNTSFHGDFAAYFKAVLKNREGELIQFDSQWIRLDEEGSTRARHMDCWHVQYALKQTQRQIMVDMNLPGCGKTTDFMRGTPGGYLSLAKLRMIGNTTAVQVNSEGKPIAMMTAKVVTWAQLFLMGNAANFTAQEIFTAGCYLERIITERERPKKSQLKGMAASLNANNHEWDGVAGWQGRGVNKHEVYWNDRKQMRNPSAWSASPAAWGGSWGEKRWRHPS